MQSEGAPAPNAVPSLGNLLCMPEETQFVSLCFCESDWGSVINWTSQLLIEGVCGIRPQVTFDAMSNSPSHSQLNTRKFGRRIW